MAEAIDRELELAKLQMAADAVRSESQAYGPVYLTLAVALLAIAYSIMPQMGLVLFLVFMGAIAFLAYLVSRVTGRYNDGIRRLDRAIEDFEAGKSLPTLTALCGVKEKK